MTKKLCKGVHRVDLGESFPTHIFLQNLVSIQPRTSPLESDELRSRGGGAHLPPTQRTTGPRPRRLPPCEGSGKLDRARSRLYRSQILQENMRLKALAEIYTMHSFAQFCNLIFFVTICQILQFYKINKISEKFRNFFTNSSNFSG